MIRLNIEKEAPVEGDFLPGEEIFLRLVDVFSDVLEKKVDELLGEKDGEVNLIFVDDKRIREINREFRGKDKPTDVISFAYLEGRSFLNGGEVNVGDIFISVETAARQAETAEHSLEKELRILFVHGLLHLFGFDHRNDEEEAEMEGWAGKILGF